MNRLIKLPMLFLAFVIGLVLAVQTERAWGLESQKKIKIAVFDNGFSGYEKSIGLSLPADTYYISAPVSSDGESTETAHGRFMAEILYARMTENGEKEHLAPELYLFKVSGYTNLKFAIDESLRLGIDIILHSMVREYGSNFDGRGFFNTEVNRAIDGGITWINAAGNFAKTTYNLNKISANSDGWVLLPGPNQSLPIRCLKPKSGAETCSLRLVLSWNSFSDDPSVGTDKDLDLVLSDDALNIIQTSSLTQTIEDSGTPGVSKYPREIIEVAVKPGRYFVRIKNRSSNFSSKDILRITADGEFIQFEKFDGNESLLNPADNPRVITVGASDSDRSSRSLKLGKPNISVPSRIEVTEKEIYLGSSNSAAIVAAYFGLIKMINSSLSSEKILKLLITKSRNDVSSNQNCFKVVNPYSSYPPHISQILRNGGVFVETPGGLKIMTPYDPITLMPGRRRVRADDMVLATPQGLLLRPRSETHLVPQNWAEIFELPTAMKDCPLPSSW